MPIRDTPPADLIACPDAPAGFTEDQAAWAIMPPPVRAAAIRLAAAYAATRAQLARLIEWQSPGACGAVAPVEPR